ncbi:T9SS C-terminal target domain-containing protein [Dokdonia sinensis]|uniref:T9SS C-terminal target domain-containing protein n=1 Tax=Dokdonia sinensis TaxID=2479847 RepID=A0A3M0GIQ4_9FLAO|nr:T9SS type A sorting domain-containing protein [Dokdonia sinensis]RMB64148.1 T9SS C-terminal target domain-containing protein [Dokdonia sinensis]
MLQKSLHFIFLFITALCCAQTSYYVKQNSGSNGNNGTSPDSPFKTIERALDELDPGDTLFIMGAYKNDSYINDYSYSGDINDPHIWHQENTIRINNLNGTPDNYISIKGYEGNTRIKGDGANLFRVTNSSYLNIEDFELRGEVPNIPLSTALALQFLYRESGSTNTLYRVQPGTTDEDVENMTFPVLNNVSRPSYTDTRGFYFSNVHHINFRNNDVHDTPGNGFRVQGCDYITIENNKVYNNSRKSYSGTHGLVVTNADSFDTETGHKIFIRNNEVYDNYNEIYSWAPSKTIITPRIDEGKGISLQRNDIANGWTHGRFLVTNNITYGNGFSGLHSNTGVRIDFVNNTAYLNSYTNSVTYADDPQGRNIGISAQGGSDNKIINNIIYIDSGWGGFPISLANEDNAEVRNNVIFGINGTLTQDNDVTGIAVNTIEANPLFEDADNADFNLQENSPAIGEADTAFAPEEDYFGNARDDNPDIGAVEFGANLSVEDAVLASVSVYPNPFTDQLTLATNNTIVSVAVYNILGQEIKVPTTIENNKATIRTSHLNSGVYFVSANGEVNKVIKQ